MLGMFGIGCSVKKRSVAKHATDIFRRAAPGAIQTNRAFEQPRFKRSGDQPMPPSVAKIVHVFELVTGPTLHARTCVLDSTAVAQAIDEQTLLLTVLAANAADAEFRMEQLLKLVRS